MGFTWEPRMGLTLEPLTTRVRLTLDHDRPQAKARAEKEKTQAEVEVAANRMEDTRRREVPFATFESPRS